MRLFVEQPLALPGSAKYEVRVEGYIDNFLRSKFFGVVIGLSSKYIYICHDTTLNLTFWSS